MQQINRVYRFDQQQVDPEDPLAASWVLSQQLNISPQQGISLFLTHGAEPMSYVASQLCMNNEIQMFSPQLRIQHGYQMYSPWHHGYKCIHHCYVTILVMYVMNELKMCAECILQLYATILDDIAFQNRRTRKR